MRCSPLPLSRVLCAAALALLAALASAQALPDRPLKIVVGYSAGGAVDVIARAVGQKLAADLGRSVIVDNKPGAGSNLASKAVIDSAPDGTTLLMAANAVAANMALFQPPPFDVERDLVPVALVGRVPVVIAVNAQAPYTTLAKLLDAARAHPETVAYASPGNGSTPHLAMELFARAAKVSFLHVPYKGGAQALTDVIGGQVSVVALNALELLPQVKSGKLVPLAVLTPQRSAMLPDVPTIAESGFPGFEASVWYGLMAPAGTPPPVVALLHDATQRALASAEMKERLAAVGGEVAPATQAAFAEHIRSERERYTRLIRAAQIKPD